MNILTIIVGIAALLFGIYTMYVRLRNPEKFGKLKAMQENFGEKRETILHVVCYSIIPIAFGIIMLFPGLIGVSLL